MSGSDANPTGGENKFNSPNIKSSVEQVEPEHSVSEAELRRKAKETVAIDGVPIDEKDIEFHSKNIKAVDNGKLFVKVEGAEERKKALIRSMKEEQKALRNEKEKRDRETKRAERKVAQAKRRESRLEHLNSIFWKGRRKYVTLATITLVIAVCVIVPVLWFKILAPRFTDLAEGAIGQAAAESSTSADEVRDKADHIYSDGDYTLDSYTEACNLFEKSISEAKKDDKVYLQMDYADFIYDNEGNAEKAISVLLEVDLSDASKTAKLDYYVLLSRYYGLIGDQENETKYKDKANEYGPTKEEAKTGLVDGDYYD